MSLATLMVTAQALSMSIPRLISTKDSPSLSGLDRRHFLSATSMALPIALVSSKAVADETSPQQFTDERFGVSFDVPAGWQRQDSSLEVRPGARYTVPKYCQYLCEAESAQLGKSTNICSYGTSYIWSCVGSCAFAYTQFLYKITTKLCLYLTFYLIVMCPLIQTAKYMGTDRRLVLYVAPGDPDTNVFAVFTPIRGDYTAVSSFGTLEQVIAPFLYFKFDIPFLSCVN